MASRWRRPLKETAEEFIRKTTEDWQSWVKSSYLPDIYQEEIIRSALVLKLHQFEDTGGDHRIRLDQPAGVS